MKSNEKKCYIILIIQKEKYDKTSFVVEDFLLCNCIGDCSLSFVRIFNGKSIIVRALECSKNLVPPYFCWKEVEDQ